MTDAHQFADCNGRVFAVRITVGMLPKLKSLGFSPIPLADAVETLNTWAAEQPDKFVAVLHTISDANKQNISLDDFADGFNGGAMSRALDAAVYGLIDFFPNPTVAKTLRSKWEQTKNQTAE